MGSKYGGCQNHSYFSRFGAVCRNSPYYDFEFLWVKKDRAGLFFDFYRTCAHVDLYAAFTPSVWWSDHDLVEYGVCANRIVIASDKM